MRAFLIPTAAFAATLAFSPMAFAAGHGGGGHNGSQYNSGGDLETDPAEAGPALHPLKENFATGTVKAYDAKTHMLELSNGQDYRVSSGQKPTTGEEVQVIWKAERGQRMATDVQAIGGAEESPSSEHLRAG